MNNKLILLLLILLIGFSSFSQEDRESDYSADIFNKRDASLDLLSNIYLRQVSLDTEFQYQENSVVIQQIGNGNYINTKTRSESSSLDLIQKGDFNNIDLVVNAPEINSIILQNWNGNSVSDNIYYSNLGVNLNAIQNGNGLSINRIGVNSLSNKLQLVQEGSFKTITLISN